MNLENIAIEENPHFNNSVQSLQSIKTNPDYVGKNLARHAFEVQALKNLKSNIRDKDSRKELEELVMKYSKGMAVDSDKFKRAHNTYHLGKVGRILGGGTIASGLMYSLPGRFYPSVNGIGGALQYLNPFSGKNLAKDAGKYLFLRGIKGIGSTLFSPFMYLSAGYAVYKLIKHLIKRKKNKNERSRLVKSLSNEELYKTLEELKQIKGIKEDYSYLNPEVNYEKAA
jgi:hypothetical protein